MKLPNYENAFIDDQKLRDYCLSESHPVGKHKAIVFKEKLGMISENYKSLKELILVSLKNSESIPGEIDIFGKRYIVDINFRNLNENIIVRTAWIIRTEEDFPRLTSCYVK